MRASWVVPFLLVGAASACGSSASGNLFGQSSPGAGASAASGGAAGSGGVVGSGGIGVGGIPLTGGAAGFSSGGFSGFQGTGGVLPFPTGGAGGDGGFMGTGGEGGSGATCAAGNYSGSYTGMYGGVLPSQVSGTIEFTVDAGGSVSGHYTSTNPNNGGKADLVGSVNCSTFVLDMRVENGTYMGILGSTVKFSGTMPGTYSTDTHAWSGTWKISDANSQSGSGTWTAQ